MESVRADVVGDAGSPARAPVFAAGTPAMIALVSIPVLVLFWLLFGAYQRHEQQYTNARDVIEVYRAGLAVLPPLDQMRSLSRAAFAMSPPPQGRVLYDAAVAHGQARMDIFLARVGQRAETELPLEAPLGRMEQMSWLEQIVVDVEADTFGPLPAITRYADGLHRLLAAVLYGADLPESSGVQSTEMLLLIPDTVRRLRYELSLLQVLALPGDMTPGAFNSADIKELDRSWNALIELGDLLESQLQEIEQRQGLLPAGKDTSRLADVRAYVDFVEANFILANTGAGWDAVWQAGLLAQDAIAAIEEGLVETAESRLMAAYQVHRRTDMLMGAGLLALYIAIVYFMIQYYRSRAVALRERELQREIEVRRRRESELMHLNQLSEALMSCHTATDACDAFARSATALFPGMRGALALMSDTAGRLLPIVAWGGEPAPLAAGFAPDSCRALCEMKPLRFPPGAVGACGHYLPGEAPGKSHACVPLAVDGAQLGLFWLEGLSDDASDLQLAVSASESLKLALTNIQLRETLQEQAVRDVLTGLYNRRHLLDVFPREIAHASRSGQPLAVAVLDIDHFKQVNDRYGHDAGDEALVAMARHMRDNLRASDFVFRLGGEEFVLLLRTDLLGGQRAVDKLRTDFQKKHFRFQDAAPCQLSFSAGVVEAPLFGQDLDVLLKLADEALYRAKTGGRNRVELARPPTADGQAGDAVAGAAPTAGSTAT